MYLIRILSWLQQSCITHVKIYFICHRILSGKKITFKKACCWLVIQGKSIWQTHQNSKYMKLRKYFFIWKFLRSDPRFLRRTLMSNRYDWCYSLDTFLLPTYINLIIGHQWIKSYLADREWGMWKRQHPIKLIFATFVSLSVCDKYTDELN